MIAQFLLPVWGFLKGVPREVYYALAALVAWWLFSSHYYDEGRESVLAELREAQEAAEKKSLEAIAEADTKAAEREEENARVIGEQLKAIETAEAEGGNALDALF